MGAITVTAAHALHQRLLRDRTIQFDFAALTIAPPHLPGWLVDLLRWLGKAFAVGFPVLRWVFWGAVALGLTVVVFLILREVAGARLPQGRRRRGERPALTDFAPDPVKALALLEDADRLASAGRYDEAARLILRRSIDDIEARRPRLVRPALTAREIARLAEVPADARTCFSAMAAIVERSAFAGRRLGADDFRDCRTRYERFAFPEAWA